MEKQKQNQLKGGRTCIACWGSCGCLYAGEQEGPGDSYYGGSSTQDNGAANQAQDIDYVGSYF